EPPISDSNIRIIRRSFRQAESFTIKPLLMQQFALRRIGNCGVSEQDLFRRKCARIVLRNAGPGAEEGHLKSDWGTVRPLKPARDVPPLVAERGMRAVILGKMKSS